MQPVKLSQDLVILGPMALAVVAGLALLLRSHRRAARASVLGALGLVGLAARAGFNYYAGYPVARWLQARVGDPSLASLLLQSADGLLVGVCAFLLVAGVVADRDGSSPPPPAGDDN